MLDSIDTVLQNSVKHYCYMLVLYNMVHNRITHQSHLYVIFSPLQKASASASPNENYGTQHAI